MTQVTRKIDSKPYPIGEFLRRGVSYRVPVYQRDFAWTAEEIDTLWEDITLAKEDGKSEYFLGAIVTSYTEEENSRDIIDGQQRLIAISMIFVAISRAWKAMGDHSRSSGIMYDFVGSEDRRTKEVMPRLTLNEINNSIFQNNIVKDAEISSADKKNIRHSNRLLLASFERTCNNLKKCLEISNDKEQYLLDIESFIAQRTYIIVIEASDESDAFVTFETLNDRGLDLAISDLVKNYLFSKGGKGNIDRFKNVWSDMSILIGGENATQFLRYLWNAEYETTRERELYKSIKNTIKNVQSARILIDRIAKNSLMYAALINPEHQFWSDYPNDYHEYLDALLLFKVTQYRPIALAAMMQFDPTNVTKILRMMVVMSFRYTVICSYNTGNLERVYSKAALSINNGESKSPRDVFDILKPLYVDDSTFSTEFQNKIFTKDDIARYILINIEKSLSSKIVPARLTLEHIYPKHPSVSWANLATNNPISTDGVDAENIVLTVGNLTLLEGSVNRRIGNKSFDEKKKEAYAQSSLNINKSVSEANSWDYGEISRRSQLFATYARTIWRLDY